MDHRAPVLLPPVPPPAAHPALQRFLELAAGVLEASWVELDLLLAGGRRPTRYSLGARTPGGRRMLLEQRGSFRADLHHDGIQPPAGLERLLSFALGQALSSFLLGLQVQLITRALDGTTSAVLLFDANGEIAYANPRAEELLVRQTMGGLQVEVEPGREVPLLSHLTRLAVRFGSQTGERLSGRHVLGDGTGVLWELAVLDPGPQGGAGASLAVVRLVCPEPAIPTGELLANFGLTRREREVVQHLLCGLSTGDIAARMGISAHTVRDHLKHAFRKTGTGSRRELVALARAEATLEAQVDPIGSSPED